MGRGGGGGGGGGQDNWREGRGGKKHSTKLSISSVREIH